VISAHEFRQRREFGDHSEDRGKPAVKRSPKVRRDLPIPEVATLERKVRLVPDLHELWSYINPFMLYGRHMGYRGDFEKHLAAREAKAVELYNEMEEVKNEAAGFMKVRAVWQFFEAEAEGETLRLLRPTRENRCRPGSSRDRKPATSYAERLRAGSKRWETRPRGRVCGDGRRGNPRPRREGKARRLLLQVARIAGPGD